MPEESNHGHSPAMFEAPTPARVAVAVQVAETIAPWQQRDGLLQVRHLFNLHAKNFRGLKEVRPCKLPNLNQDAMSFPLTLNVEP